MKELLNFIEKNSTNKTENIKTSIASMLCNENSPIPLSAQDLLNALMIKGEFLVLNLHYDDFEDELKYEKIKHKISQALSIIVRYEDDGNCFERVDKFVQYISVISDEKQNSTFGVKKVKKLSKFPVTVLFSGILPINQLNMSIGSKIYELIDSDREYFSPRFKKLRDDITKDIGIPILPLFPIMDKNIGPFNVSLVDLINNRVISEFEVCQKIDNQSLEIYLLKLFYVYRVLGTT